MTSKQDPTALHVLRERWAQVSALLDEVSTQPPEARAAWIGRHCEDPELRKAVAAMLERMEGPLAADRLLATSADPDLALRLEDIGPYRLLRRLARAAWAPCSWPSATWPAACSASRSSCCAKASTNRRPSGCSSASNRSSRGSNIPASHG